MCEATATYDGNKTLVCQVGDLTNGDQYRTPEGNTMLVLHDPVHDDEDGYRPVACMQNGVILRVSNSIKLGRDRAGRLYASRSLNDPVITGGTVRLQTVEDMLTTLAKAFGYPPVQ